MHIVFLITAGSSPHTRENIPIGEHTHPKAVVTMDLTSEATPHASTSFNSYSTLTAINIFLELDFIILQGGLTVIDCAYSTLFFKQLAYSFITSA